MRDKWVLKSSFSDLRKNKGLSMESLAELAYTTNTTIFRIEKTGVIADFALAEKLASVFDISLDEFCTGDFASDRTNAEWNRLIEEPYLTQADVDGSYYLVFVSRYEKHGEYSAISPTVWKWSENGKECRSLRCFSPDGIIEHLAECGVKCAVAHDAQTLIFFYYGIPDKEERAVLVRTDVADSVFPEMEKEYICDINGLPNHYGFKDLVDLRLHAESDLPNEQ